MHEDKLALCLKISQKQWIEKLMSGTAWFGLINNFIDQAKKTGNNDQGDAYEGIFARCKKTSPLVSDLMTRFGADLEAIDDGEYCLFRRRSSRQALVFCMYGIRNSDLTITEVFDEDSEEPTGKFHYNISPEMYRSFLQDGSLPSDIAGYYCSAGHINTAIESSLKSNGYRWKRDLIQYDIDLTSEFYIEPTDEYPELFHKRIELAYQHESRFLLYDITFTGNGIAIPFKPLSKASGNMAVGELYIEGTASMRRLK